MKNINVRTLSNSRDAGKYDIFATIGRDDVTYMCNFNIDTDNVELDNNLHSMTGILEPVSDNGVNTNVIGIMFSHELLTNKSTHSIADTILKVNKFLNTEENRVIGITIVIITPVGAVLVHLTSIIEENKIFELAGVLSYIDVLLNNGMIDTNEHNYIEFKPKEEVPQESIDLINDFMSTTSILSKVTNE